MDQKPPASHCDSLADLVRCSSLLVLCFRTRAAPEAVRRLRQGPLPPDADPQGGEGPPETVPDHAKRGSGREVDAHHHAAAGEPRETFSGTAIRFLVLSVCWA